MEKGVVRVAAVSFPSGEAKGWYRWRRSPISALYEAS